MADIFSDTFTEASDTDLNAHTPDTGTGWTTPTWSTGTCQLLGSEDRIRSPSAGSSYYSDLVDDATTDADYTVRADILADNYGGIIGRSSTSEETHYWVRFDASSRLQLFKVVAGSATQLGTDVTGWTNTTYYTVELVMSGTTISVKVDGNTEISETDSSITAKGLAGVRMRSTLSRLDNFAVDDPSAGGGAALAGALTASGSVTGALTTAIQLAGAFTASGSVTGALTTGIQLAGDLNAVATVTADLDAAAALAGELSAVATVSADLTTAIQLAGDLNAVANVTAALAADGAALEGALIATGTTTAALTTAIRLNGALSASGTATAALTTGIALAAGLNATGDVSGGLTTGILLAGGLSATATVTANLTGGSIWSTQAENAAAWSDQSPDSSIWSDQSPNSGTWTEQ